MNDEKELWSKMFDLQYDLCQEVDRLIKPRIAKFPKEWRSAAMLYLVEHLAESARFQAELPDLPPLPDNEDDA